MSELLTFVDLYSKGLPPVSGGVLDQSQWFIAACQRVWSEESYWQRHIAEHGKEN